MPPTPAQPAPRTGFRWMTLLLALPSAAGAVFTAALGATLAWAWHPERASVWPSGLFDVWLAPLREPGVLELIRPGGYAEIFHAYAIASLLAAAAMSVCFVMAFIRRPVGLFVIRAGYVACYMAVGAVVWAVWRLSGFLEVPPDRIASVGYFGLRGTYLPRFWWWYDLAWPLLLAVPAVGLFHIAAHRAAAVHVYTGRNVFPAAGDRLIENVRSHGKDPVYRKSWLASAIGHATVIVLIPWLLSWFGCAERYHVPEGGGEPAVAVVQVVQPEQVETDTLIVNPRAAISFHVPRLEESMIEQQVNQATELAYQTTMEAAGPTGKGAGEAGGWPDGMGRHPVRFIRIKGHGPGWEDGMDADSRADMNFLEQFHQLTGFAVAEASEARTIRQIAAFDKGYAPPFVYMTGEGHIRISNEETRLLRAYLLDGGMLFADAGHPAFHNALVNYIRRELLPDHRLIPIADDDPIFQRPYTFPNGAPPLWHHGGRKAMGVKARVNGRDRWVVFYHPGDINDAWKTGRSGLDRGTAQGAVHMGVNIIYYAFTHYLEDTQQYR